MVGPLSKESIRLGVAGLGRAFTVMVPTFTADLRIELVAGADPRPEAQAQFESEFGGVSFASLEDLLAGAEVDAVYLATPVPFHLKQVRTLAAAGKHILMEKPMGLTIEESREMTRIARDSGIHMIVGHSHSFDAPIRLTRELIEAGEVGLVRMITAMNFTDFMYRPRRPDELITEQGGGVVFSQGAHQIDIIRLLGGGMVKSVRAVTGQWDPARPTEGAYSALLTFENGIAATTVYSGYAHFDSDEFVGWRSELGETKDPDVYWTARDNLAKATETIVEADLKAARNFGGSQYKPASRGQTDMAHQHFGSLIVSCDHADLRPLPWGVMIYGDQERSSLELPPPDVPRVEVIDELAMAVWDNVAPRHDGDWATATLEVCLAILESAKTGKDVELSHQCSPAA
jgi:phthalate 4,5-cis-dihydrodiol dehydrogenase